MFSLFSNISNINYRIILLHFSASPILIYKQIYIYIINVIEYIKYNNGLYYTFKQEIKK